MATKPKVTNDTIQIPAPNIKQMLVHIKGTSPLIYHKWDEKAKQMILDKQMKKVVKKEARDPEAEYLNSFYYDSEGNIAFPARNIKQAIVGSARFLNGVAMTVLRGTVFTVGDKDGFIPILINGKKVKPSTLVQEVVNDHIAGMDEKNNSIKMRRDMVTVGMGGTDIRFRGQVEDWEMEFLIKFDADVLSPEQVLNLLQRAGFSQGLGEWRAEKNGESGAFEVVSTSKEV